MKISTGNSSAAATTDRISVMPLLSVADPERAAAAAAARGVVVLIRSTRSALPSCDRSATLRPMTMISEFGAGRAAEPIVPIERARKAVAELRGRSLAQQRRQGG